MAQHRNHPPADDHDGDERDDSVIGRAFWRSVAILVPVAALVGGGVWWAGRKPPPPPPREAKLELPKGRAEAAVKMPPLPFTDVTAAAGIDFVHENGAAGEKLLPETMGGGCAFFDADGDGDQDLVLVQGARWPWDERPAPSPAPTARLYENDGRGAFRDATAGSGLDVPFYGTGVAAGDYDGDGLVDLFLTAVGPARLLRDVGEAAAAVVAVEPREGAGEVLRPSVGAAAPHEAEVLGPVDVARSGKTARVSTSVRSTWSKWRRRRLSHSMPGSSLP